MKSTQLKEIIREKLGSVKEGETVTIKDLEFGKHIQKGDSLPKPNSDEMSTISTEDQLKWWKEDLEKAKVDFNSEVIINRNAPWFDRIKIPAFEEGSKAASKSRGDFLNKEREQGRNKGLDEVVETDKSKYVDLWGLLFSCMLHFKYALDKGDLKYDEKFLRNKYNDIKNKMEKLKPFEETDIKDLDEDLLKYEVSKALEEMSTSGGSASMTVGTGEQYSTPYAFKGKKKLPIIKKAIKNS
jgi:hypothetical protein